MDKNLLKGIISLNQAEMPYDVIDRDVELPIDRNKIITVAGVRRCGKSSKMKLVINQLLQSGVEKERILWIGFDDERLLPMSSENLDEILKAYLEMYPNIPLKKVYMFFDEIQLIPQWEYFILRVFKSYCQNIYISGSNATMLSTELVSALRGYPLEYPTFPLSFNEFCRFRNIDTKGWLESTQARIQMELECYNSGSSFPEVVLTEFATDKIKILQGYYDTMLLKDVAEHYKISNIRVLRYLTKRIMGNLTKPTSINAIYYDIKSQGLKVSKDDLYDWATYLCNVFMFIKLPAFSKSLKVGKGNLDKYYCIDNGLRQAVLRPMSEDQGKLLENTVFLELNRRLQPFESLFYYNGKCECDFVRCNHDEVIELIQVSYDINDKDTCKREIAGLIEASISTGCNNLLLLTFDQNEDQRIGERTIKVRRTRDWLLNR